MNQRMQAVLDSMKTEDALKELAAWKEELKEIKLEDELNYLPRKDANIY